MIRRMTPKDIEGVGAIWLAASIKAHKFVDADFWRTNLSTMTKSLLPESETYVHLSEESLDAFITLGGNVIHCLFVEPSRQRGGIGSALLSHVKLSDNTLRLKVYQENAGARKFYETHGFTNIGETTCPHTGCAEFEMEWNKNETYEQHAGQASSGAAPGTSPDETSA